MPFQKDLLVLRADHYSAACHRLLLEAQATGRLDAIVVADTRKRVFSYEGVRQVSFSAQSARQMGLPTRRDMQWRCGDYAYYLAANAQPCFRNIWLVETDLRLCFSQVQDFFRMFDACDADYLTSGLRPALDDWSWTVHVRSLRNTPFRSFFPLTRISQRACLHLLQQRRNQSQALANDESFAATVLVNDGFDCRELESVAPGLYARPGYSFDYPVLDRAYDRLVDTRKIYHPVLRDRLFLKRLRRYHGFPKNRRLIFEEACAAYDIPPERVRHCITAAALAIGAVTLLAIVLAFNNHEDVEDLMQVIAMLMTSAAVLMAWRTMRQR